MTDRVNAQEPALNREGWLTRVAERVTPWFEEAELELQPYRVACGWPSSGALPEKGMRTLGQCWHAECSAGGVREIFISPCLVDPVEVAQVLVHEMLHAALDPLAGHGPLFRKGMKPLLLGGKPTATEVTDAFRERIAPVLEEVGPYPHDVLDAAAIAASRKKQGTRMLKVVCPACGYTLRTTAKWLEVGLPTCCCGEQMEQEGGE